MSSDDTESRLINKLKSIIRLGSTHNSVSERGGLPLQKVFYLGKSAESVPLFPYGMHARPKKNWLSVIFSYSARSENRWHMTSSAERRPTDLKDGEVVFYHPPTMAEIRLKSDGTIEATTSLFKVNGNFEVTGDQVNAGAITATGEVTSGSVTVTGHAHAILSGSSSPGPTDVGSG